MEIKEVEPGNWVVSVGKTVVGYVYRSTKTRWEAQTACGDQIYLQGRYRIITSFPNRKKAVAAVRRYADVQACEKG